MFSFIPGGSSRTILTTAGVAYTANYFVNSYVARYLKNEIEKRDRDFIGADLHIGSCKLHLLSGVVRLKNVTLDNPLSFKHPNLIEAPMEEGDLIEQMKKQATEIAMVEGEKLATQAAEAAAQTAIEKTGITALGDDSKELVSTGKNLLLKAKEFDTHTKTTGKVEELPPLLSVKEIVCDLSVTGLLMGRGIEIEEFSLRDAEIKVEMEDVWGPDILFGRSNVSVLLEEITTRCCKKAADKVKEKLEAEAKKKTDAILGGATPESILKGETSLGDVKSNMEKELDHTKAQVEEMKQLAEKSVVDAKNAIKEKATKKTKNSNSKKVILRKVDLSNISADCRGAKILLGDVQYDDFTAEVGDTFLDDLILILVRTLLLTVMENGKNIGASMGNFVDGKQILDGFQDVGANLGGKINSEVQNRIKSMNLESMESWKKQMADINLKDHMHEHVSKITDVDTLKGHVSSITEKLPDVSSFTEKMPDVESLTNLEALKNIDTEAAKARATESAKMVSGFFSEKFAGVVGSAKSAAGA